MCEWREEKRGRLNENRFVSANTHQDNRPKMDVSDKSTHSSSGTPLRDGNWCGSYGSVGRDYMWGCGVVGERSNNVQKERGKSNALGMKPLLLLIPTLCGLDIICSLL